MLVNHFTIEKFKISHDDEGNEILTPVDVIKGQKEIKQSNKLACTLPYCIENSTRVIDYIDVDDDFFVFDNYKIMVSPLKINSRSNLISYSSSLFSEDSSYDNTDKVIIGDVMDNSDTAAVSGTDTITLTMKARFQPPSATTRTINTIFIGRYPNNTNGSRSALSSVMLDTPCVQLTDEVLIINYRYVFDLKTIAEKFDGYTQSPEIFRKFAKKLGVFYGDYRDGLLGEPDRYQITSMPTLENNKYILGNFSGSFLLNHPFVNLAKRHDHESVFELEVDYSVSDEVGKLISTILLQGDSNFQINRTTNNDNIDYQYLPMGEFKLRRPQDSAVQSTFKKRMSTVDVDSAIFAPFYDATQEGTSLGGLLITDTITDDTSYITKGTFAELFRIEITSAGAAGTAEYKLAKRTFSSFTNSASWICHRGSTSVLTGQEDYPSDMTITDMTFRNDIAYLAGRQAIRQSISAQTLQPLQLNEIAILSNDLNAINNGIFIHCLDLTKSQYPFKLDSTLLPTFLASDIRGMCTAEDGTMFVACASTGLWKLTRNLADAPEATTVTRITNTGATDDTSCKAVNFGRYGHRFGSDGKLVALFGDELCISLDGGTTWSMYNNSTTPAFNPVAITEEVVGINIHPDHDEVVIITTPNVYKCSQGTSVESSANTLKAYLWKQLNGSIDSHTGSQLGGEYNGFVHQYGGGNAIIRPATNNGSYKWIIHHTYASSSRSYAYAFNDINTIITNSTDFGRGMELIYDSDRDDVYVIYKDEQYYHAHLLSDLMVNNNTTEKLIDFSSGNDTAEIIAIGRGVFMGTSDYNDVSNVYGNSISNGSSAYESVCKVLHVCFRDNPSKDYYVNNQLNLWYKYGWNGTNWELDNPNSKVTSLSSEPIIEGLNVQFINDAGLPTSPDNFILGEIWDTYAYDGIVKDDYTAFNAKGLIFYGLSEEGSDFFPNVVPANPVGQAKRQISAEYWKGHLELVTNTNDGDASSASPIFFSKDFICQSTFKYSFNNTDAENNFIPIGPVVPSSSDFTYEFKLSATLTDWAFTDEDNISYENPSIIIVDPTTASESGYGSILLGLRIHYNLNNPNDAILKVHHLITANNFTISKITLTDFNPKTDIFELERDTTEGNIVLKWKGTEILSLNYPLYTGELRLVFQGRGQSSDNSIGNGIVYGVSLLNIYDMYLTFNDTRLMSKIGNGVNTGAWASNYGRMSTLEYTKGIKKIFLDGVEASIVYSNIVDVPQAGEVKINSGTGELVFNPADAGKVITGTWRYLPESNKRTI